MIRYLYFSFYIILTRDRLREHSSEKILIFQPLNLGRNFLAAGKTQEC